MFTELVKTLGIIVDVLPLSGGIKLCIISRSDIKRSDVLTNKPSTHLTVIRFNKHEYQGSK